MPAGFLITRLLLVFVLTEINYDAGLVTAQNMAQPQAVQGARRHHEDLIRWPPRNANQPIKLQDVQNLWSRFIESLAKNQAEHQRQQQQQIPSPYPQSQVHVKHPMEEESSSSQSQPAVEPKKVELNVNIPLQSIVKALAASKRSDWFRDSKGGESSPTSRLQSQDETGGPPRPDRKFYFKDPHKRKGDSVNPGFNLKLSAPIQGFQDRGNLQRPEDGQDLVKPGFSSAGPDWPVLFQRLREHYGSGQSLTQSGCPPGHHDSGHPCQQQMIRPIWPMIQNILQPQEYPNLPPTYPNPPPSYHNPPLTHPNPPPAYLNPLPAYFKLPPPHHNPPPAYHNPPPAHHNPPSTYHNPPLSHHSPPSIYHNPPLAHPHPTPRQLWPERIPPLPGFQWSTGPHRPTHNQMQQKISIPDRVKAPDSGLPSPRTGCPRHGYNQQWLRWPRSLER